MSSEGPPWLVHGDSEEQAAQAAEIESAEAQQAAETQAAEADLARLSQPVSYDHGGKIHSAESLRALVESGVCPFMGKMSLENAGVMLDLISQGQQAAATGDNPPPWMVSANANKESAAFALPKPKVEASKPSPAIEAERAAEASSAVALETVAAKSAEAILAAAHVEQAYQAQASAKTPEETVKPTPVAKPRPIASPARATHRPAPQPAATKAAPSKQATPVRAAESKSPASTPKPEAAKSASAPAKRAEKTEVLEKPIAAEEPSTVLEAVSAPLAHVIEKMREAQARKTAESPDKSPAEKAESVVIEPAVEAAVSQSLEVVVQEISAMLSQETISGSKPALVELARELSQAVESGKDMTPQLTNKLVAVLHEMGYRQSDEVLRAYLQTGEAKQVLQILRKLAGIQHVNAENKPGLQLGVSGGTVAAAGTQSKHGIGKWLFGILVKRDYALAGSE